MTMPVGLCIQLVPLTPATLMPYRRADGTDVTLNGSLHNAWPSIEPALAGGPRYVEPSTVPDGDVTVTCVVSG
jgi:hypothetical protein